MLSTEIAARNKNANTIQEKKWNKTTVKCRSNRCFTRL